MCSKKASWNWTIVCSSLLFVSSSFALSYKAFEADPSIESIIKYSYEEKEKILQYCIDRSDDRMLTLLGGINRMIRTELGKTEIDILNNRVNEQVREYTNDIWLLIDQEEKALDILFKNSERRIESKLGNQSKALDKVEEVFGEMSKILWSWQDANANLLYDTNERGQQIADGLAYDALDALQNSGWEGVEQVLFARRDAALQLSNDTRDQIIESGENDNIRIHQLAQVLRNAIRQN